MSDINRIESTMPNMILYCMMFLRYGCKTDAERLQLIHSIKSYCCIDCGRSLGGDDTCHCENDE